jgi:hypothetical protein
MSIWSFDTRLSGIIVVCNSTAMPPSARFSAYGTVTGRLLSPAPPELRAPISELELFVKSSCGLPKMPGRFPKLRYLFITQLHTLGRSISRDVGLLVYWAWCSREHDAIKAYRIILIILFFCPLTIFLISFLPHTDQAFIGHPSIRAILIPITMKCREMGAGPESTGVPLVGV